MVQALFTNQLALGGAQAAAAVGLALLVMLTAYAAIYQFVTIAMMVSAAGLTALISSLLIRSQAFSPAEQLTLRLQAAAGPGGGRGGSK